MKILYLLTKISIGGTEAVARDLALMAKKYGHEVTVMTFLKRSNHITETLKKNQIQTLNFPSSNPLSIANFIFFIQTLKKEDYDIIHSHTEEADFYISFMSYFLSFKPTLVMTEHYYRYKNIRFNPFRRMMYKRYKKIICVSQEMQTYFHQYSEKIYRNSVVIHNGVALNKYSKGSPTEKITSEPIQILCNARLVKQKDITTCIKACAHVKTNIQLLITGEGKLRKKLLSLIGHLKLEKKVLLLGWREDISELLEKAHIYVQSSLWEGCSIAILEAMAAGLPLIVSNATGIIETVDNAALIFPIGDAKKLAMHIDSLAKNQDLRARLSELSLRRAEEFSLEKMWANHAQLYEKIVCFSH